MGLTIMVETEDGERIEQIADPLNLLHQLLPSHDDQAYQCLRYIDWYGDTVFNRLQMDTFLTELNGVRRATRSPAEIELLAQIEKLARRCQAEPHLYLKFYGD